MVPNFNASVALGTAASTASAAVASVHTSESRGVHLSKLVAAMPLAVTVVSSRPPGGFPACQVRFYPAAAAAGMGAYDAGMDCQ